MTNVLQQLVTPTLLNFLIELITTGVGSVTFQAPNWCTQTPHYHFIRYYIRRHLSRKWLLETIWCSGINFTFSLLFRIRNEGQLIWKGKRLSYICTCECMYISLSFEIKQIPENVCHFSCAMYAQTKLQ